MYYSISGKALIKENFVVIHSGGIGYKIFTSNSTISKIPRNDDVTIYTYLNVKEDALDIYGFITEEELATFKLLISVSGVGPKAALAVLSALAPAEFAMAVVTQDAKTITAAQGVGKRLAEKIIVELKDKLGNVSLTEITQDGIDGTPNVSGTIMEEAVNALMVLGYSSLEARQAVKKVAGQAENLEDLIKSALKSVGR